MDDIDPVLTSTDWTLEHVFISSGHAYWGKRDAAVEPHAIHEILEVQCLAGKGLEGDRYSTGRAGRLGQVTFFEAEVVESIRERFSLAELSATVFRRNLIVRGVRLRALLGRRFAFGGVEFEGTQECKPCVWMDRAVADGAQAFMREAFRGGLRARVLTDGVLRVDR